MRIGVMGLGKLGLCTSLCLAKDHNVMGYDVSKDRVKYILSDVFQSNEPEVERLLRQREFIFTLNILEFREFAKTADAIFIIVPTPSKDDHTFDDSLVRNAVAAIADYAGEECIINVVSTVMPGTCDQLSQDYPRLTFTYNPEFIALGSIIRDFMNPDFILIGGSTWATDRIAEVYVQMIPQGVHVRTMSFVQAEITKLALNCACTLKITYANMIDGLCEYYNCDSTRVLQAVGNDHRIGSPLLKPGLGFGGPCFPRDVRALAKIMPRSVSMMDNVIIENEFRKCVLTERLRKIKGRVLWLGLSYKKCGTTVDESMAFELLEWARTLIAVERIDAWDPCVNTVPDGVQFVESYDTTQYDFIVDCFDYLEKGELIHDNRTSAHDDKPDNTSGEGDANGPA